MPHPYGNISRKYINRLTNNKNLYFCTFDANNTRNGFVAIEVATGNMNIPVTLVINDLQGGDE